MKKRMISITIIIVAGLMAGCSILPRFQQAEEQYLETRIAEMLEEMPEEAPQEEIKEIPLIEEIEEPIEEPIEELTPTVEEVEVEETEEAEEAAEPKEIEATPSPEPTAKPQPTPTVESSDPGEYLGKPEWADSFKDARYWVFGVDTFSVATLENEQMKMVAQTEEPGWRIASTKPLKNAYIEASFQVGKCADTDRYGIIFRVPEKVDYNQGYIFSVTCDGRYSLRLWDGIAKKSIWVKPYTVHEAINKGSSSINRLGVMTLDNDLGLFVNGVRVDLIEDDTFKEGYFGVYINRDKTDKLTVLVDEAKYWLNPTAK